MSGIRLRAIAGMQTITILIPCYNEEKSLPMLMQELEKLKQGENQYDWEFLFVNDGSKDNTLELVKSYHAADASVHYVDLSRNFGKENAMLAGFDYAQGDCVVIIDADLQDPPEIIPEMIGYWRQGYQDVYARRRSRGKESWLRRKLSLAYYGILQHSSRFDVLQNVGDFRLLDRKCVDALKKLRESERYTKGLFCWIGYKKKEVLFDRHDRVAGQSSFNFRKLFALALDGITSFTTAPLRISTVMGFLLSVFAFLYMCYFLAKTIFFGDPIKGFPTLIIVILLLGGIQLLSLGIIGEYLGRVFNESKNRPVYLINEYSEDEKSK